MKRKALLTSKSMSYWLNWIKSEDDWIRVKDDVSWMDCGPVLQLHREFHARFGARTDVPDGLLELERMFTIRLNQLGMPHRHNDAMYATSGVEAHSIDGPASLREVEGYVCPGGGIILDSQAVSLVQDVANPRAPVYLAASPDAQRAYPGILKALNRQLPPGVLLRQPPAKAEAKSAGIVAVLDIFELAFREVQFAETRTTTWANVSVKLQASAAKASPVFASGVNLSFQVIKNTDAWADDQRIVTGAVLVPDVPDLTTTNPDGTPTGAEGDVYSADEILKAMYWWSENSGKFEYHHGEYGGVELTTDDVVLLENWQKRGTGTVGDQEIPEGTWMKTVRVLNDNLWRDIRSGAIRSWSVGLRTMAELEAVEVPIA